MTLAWNLTQFILILIVLVLVHEWGHMWVAKRCGMRVERFSVFFGRPLTSFRRGETEYAIGWLPLGGYVKISGMTRDEEIPPEVEHRAYYAAPVWKRVATIAAGPGINVVAAILLFAMVAWIGEPTFTATNRVDHVTAESPAQSIGMQQGDEIVAIQGVRVRDADQVRTMLEGRPGEVTAITYTRNGREITRQARLTSETNPQGQQVGRLGFRFHVEEGPVQRAGPIKGLQLSVRFSWMVVSETGKILGRQFVQPDIDQVNSVVGAGAVYNKVADQHVSTVFRFAGLLSLALAIFNLIPIPPLDGGHIAFALAEKARGGKPVPRRVMETLSMVGMAAILLFAIVLIQNDIFRIANGTLMP